VFPILVIGPVKFAFVVTVAALPPMFKFATGVVDVTINGAVPVATVDVIDPLTFKLVPVAAPIFGVTKVGEVLITTFPVPVIRFETIFLLASVNNACEAVAEDKTGAVVNVLAPAIVCAEVVTIPPFVPSAGDSFKTPDVKLAAFALDEPMVPIDIAADAICAST